MHFYVALFGFELELRRPRPLVATEPEPEAPAKTSSHEGSFGFAPDVYRPHEVFLTSGGSQ